MLSPIHRMTARSRFRRRCPGIRKRAAVGCSSDAPFYRCIHLLPPIRPSALATVSGPFSRCHLACGEAHPVFNALLAAQEVGERLPTSDAASVMQARVDKAGKGSGRAGQRTYLKGVHDPEVQPGSGDPDLLRSALAHRLNATVGNLGHVIAEPAFVQAEHAAAGGRDDAMVRGLFAGNASSRSMFSPSAMRS